MYTTHNAHITGMIIYNAQITSMPSTHNTHVAYGHNHIMHLTHNAHIKSKHRSYTPIPIQHTNSIHKYLQTIHI